MNQWMSYYGFQVGEAEKAFFAIWRTPQLIGIPHFAFPIIEYKLKTEKYTFKGVFLYYYDYTVA